MKILKIELFIMIMLATFRLCENLPMYVFTDKFDDSGKTKPCIEGIKRPERGVK